MPVHYQFQVQFQPDFAIRRAPDYPNGGAAFSRWLESLDLYVFGLDERQASEFALVVSLPNVCKSH